MSTPRTQRGRRMWLAKDGHTLFSYSNSRTKTRIPVAVLDLREEAVEKMVEAVARALVAWERNRYGRVISGSHVHPMQARATLQAILPLRRGRGGK